MKSKILFAFGMLSVFTLSGCSDDFLDLTPPTDTVGEYFNTQEHVEEALVAAYNPLQWPDWGNNYYCPINLMSDIMADASGLALEQDRQPVLAPHDEL